MVEEIRIKTIERPDGTDRVYILARDDGLFRYESQAEKEAGGHLYWGCLHLPVSLKIAV
jgi:hypothetical protein